VLKVHALVVLIIIVMHVHLLLLLIHIHMNVYDANFQEVIAQFVMLVMSLLLEEFVLKVKLVV
jgi:hypothetical protein